MSERFRPKFHFTSKVNWINDPNGLLWHNGRYHLYFQHNPFGTAWGHMSWGHASSVDLLSWDEHEVAIPEDEGTGEMIFSGSAVFDASGSCGVQNSIVACYTSNSVPPAKPKQYQSIAISKDGGYTFEKYGKPVLDRDLEDYRDPKVFKFQDEWRMVVVLSKEHRAEILRSTNLIDWESLSFFGEPEAPEVVWECPDLFPLELNGKTHWVLIISVNPGGPLNGSGTKYYVGDFDGTTFTSDQPAQWLDHGRDNYAGVTFNDDPNGERILIGWMNSWGKTEHPSLPWTGAMTIPRKLGLALVDGRILLTQEPIVAPSEKITLNADNDWQVTLNSELVLRYNLESATIEIAGYSAHKVFDGDVEFEVLRDACSVEIFNLDRTISFTFLTFAE